MSEDIFDDDGGCVEFPYDLEVDVEDKEIEDDLQDEDGTEIDL